MGRSSNSKQLILTAAIDLLWEKSYHPVTVDEVCVRAGVHKASLYHFFDSKSALTLAALQHFWETIAKPAYEKHFSPANPPLDRIKDFLCWLQDLQREKFPCSGRVPGWPFFTLGCELGAREPAISEGLCEIEAAELLYFESAIRDALDRNVIRKTDPRVEALSFRAAVEGCLARARILNDPNQLSALTELHVNILRLKPPGTATPSRRNRSSAQAPDVPVSTTCFVCHEQIAGGGHIRFYRVPQRASEAANAQAVKILLCSSACALRYFATLEQETRSH
jgi:TetR/AcrR family transcriptional regulator, transcriptional repressor for nem operon